MNAFQPERIIMACDYNGYSLRQLSQKIGKSPTYLSKIISEDDALTEQIVEQISFESGFPLTFFMQHDGKGFATEELTFRKKGRHSSRMLAKTGTEYRLLAEASRKLYDMCGIGDANKWLDAIAPTATMSIEDIETLTQQVRAALHINLSGAIRNMADVLDGLHIVVASLNQEAPDGKTDGVCRPACPYNDTVIGLYTKDKTGDRIRFTLAHEFGHLILHRFRRPLSDDLMEREANRFASAFLFPRDDAMHAISTTTTLKDFMSIKAGWGVSMAALIYRANELGIIDSSRYKALYTHMANRRWLKNEPVAVTIEQPVLLQQMVAQSFGDIDDVYRPTASRHGVEGFLGLPFAMVNGWCRNELWEREALGIGGIEGLLN